MHQRAPGCPASLLQPQTPRQPPSGRTPERAYTACRAELDRALAEADTLRGRVAELKRSLEYVSNFERFGGIGPIESVVRTPRSIQEQAHKLDAEHRKVANLRHALVAERSSLEGPS